MWLSRWDRIFIVGLPCLCCNFSDAGSAPRNHYCGLHDCRKGLPLDLGPEAAQRAQLTGHRGVPQVRERADSYPVIDQLDALWAGSRQRCHRGEIVGQIAL